MEYKIREKLFGANKRSASGTSLALNDTVKYPINKLTIDGVCKQETTTGKNLFDYVSNLITSANGLTSVINDDGSITTSGKPTLNYSKIIDRIDITDILEDGQKYTISQGNASDKVYVQIAAKKVDGAVALITSENGSKSFTVNKTIYTNYSIMLQTNTISSWGDSPLTITNKYMLCKGTDTADTSFETYTGGQPSPSPDYPQEIKTIENSLKITSCGKNLIDLSEFFDTTLNGITITNNRDGSLTLNGTATGNIITPIIKYKYAKESEFGIYTFKCFGLPSNCYNDVWYGNPRPYGEGISRVEYKNKTDNYAIILNIPNGTSLTNVIIRPILVKGSYTSNNFPSFEQHLETQIQANLPDGEFIGKINDTYKDTLNVVYKDDGQYHLVLNKMIGKIVLDGTENWSYDSNNKYFRANTYAFERIPLPLSSESRAMYSQISNSFIINKNWSGTNSFRDNINVQGEFYPVQNKGYKLAFRNLNFDNVDDFKSYLSSKNIIVVYPLETPYEVDLGIVDQLLTFDEITNIFTDSDLYPVINVKYYNGSLDISNYEFSIKEV